MTSLKTRLQVGLTTGALVATLIAPNAYADTTIDISGNGNNSNNTANVVNNNTLNVVQSNNMVVNFTINSSADTGKNKANNNTGGDVAISTGNAKSKVSVDVVGGSNTINLDGCLCNGTTNDTVNVTDNGNGTTNNAKVKNKKATNLVQGSNVVVSGSVDSKAKTGKNKANNNTNGTANVTTKNSKSKVTVNVTAPDNTVNP